MFYLIEGESLYWGPSFKIIIDKTEIEGGGSFSLKIESLDFDYLLRRGRTEKNITIISVFDNMSKTTICKLVLIEREIKEDEGFWIFQKNEAS